MTKIENRLERDYPNSDAIPEQILGEYAELRATHDASVAALWSNSFDTAGTFSIDAEQRLRNFTYP